ncbi:MAG: hypothetical protein FWE29_04790 [Defluviitaleaceae bacterium]|nr:hypothetical protein [Defluviitaleaceae bacterium]
MKKYLKLFLVSLIFIGIVTVLSFIYGLIAHGFFTLRYIFDSNFSIGVAAIVSGVFYMFFPSSMLSRGDKLMDHSTFAERSFKARQRRQNIAMDMILVGISIIITAGLVQILLSVLI